MDSIDLETLVAGFEDTSLPKASWTHAAHISVAFHYVSTLDEATALATTRANIQRYNASKGGPPSAYHETVTRAFLMVVRAFVRARGAEARVEDAVAMFDKNYLDRFYTRERLFSEEARARWVAPDREPLETA